MNTASFRIYISHLTSSFSSLTSHNKSFGLNLKTGLYYSNAQAQRNQPFGCFNIADVCSAFPVEAGLVAKQVRYSRVIVPAEQVEECENAIRDVLYNSLHLPPGLVSFKLVELLSVKAVLVHTLLFN